MPVSVPHLPEWARQAYQDGCSVARLAARLEWSRGRTRRAIIADLPGQLRSASEQARLAAARMAQPQRKERIAKAHARHMELAEERRKLVAAEKARIAAAEAVRHAVRDSGWSHGVAVNTDTPRQPFK